jgi:hypothetical protein
MACCVYKSKVYKAMTCYDVMLGCGMLNQSVLGKVRLGCGMLDYGMLSNGALDLCVLVYDSLG